MAIVGVGGVAAFTGISFYNGNEKFYENILMPTIQKVSGETAHELAIFLCKHNLFPSSTLKDPESLVSFSANYSTEQCRSNCLNFLENIVLQPPAFQSNRHRCWIR